MGLPIDKRLFGVPSLSNRQTHSLWEKKKKKVSSGGKTRKILLYIYKSLLYMDLYISSNTVSSLRPADQSHPTPLHFALPYRVHVTSLLPTSQRPQSTEEKGHLRAA